jgi:hypothetical protein
MLPQRWQITDRWTDISTLLIDLPNKLLVNWAKLMADRADKLRKAVDWPMPSKADKQYHARKMKPLLRHPRIKTMLRS